MTSLCPGQHPISCRPRHLLYVQFGWLSSSPVAILVVWGSPLGPDTLDAGRRDVIGTMETSEVRNPGSSVFTVERRGSEYPKRISFAVLQQAPRASGGTLRCRLPSDRESCAGSSRGVHKVSRILLRATSRQAHSVKSRQSHNSLHASKGDDSVFFCQIHGSSCGHI
jgi:hypothetical protein